MLGRWRNSPLNVIVGAIHESPVIHQPERAIRESPLRGYIKDRDAEDVVPYELKKKIKKPVGCTDFFIFLIMP